MVGFCKGSCDDNVARLVSVQLWRLRTIFKRIFFMAVFPPRLSRAQYWLLGAVVVVAVLLLWFFVLRTPEETLPPPPNPWAGPVPVRTAAATREDLQVHIKAIGTVVPLNTVTVRSRADGPITKITFEEGQMVAAGDLLAEIDPAPYRVRLAQAEGTLQQTAAQLQNAEDDFVLYQRLFKQ